MALTIAVLKETQENETRVAATPETVKKYISAGAAVQIETKAGAGAHILDEYFQNAGAKICKSATETLKSADIILKVTPPSEKEIESFPAKSLCVTQINPYQNEKLIAAFAKQKVNAMAMELIPRISRAQSMDVLSSQANLAGYKSVLDACEYYAHAMPMMMTAAGTVPPAKVFVMGAGVAGLQAIATAKRLGGVVSATDVRPAAKEQVESLGGSFVAVEDEEFKAAETAGGYAKEMSKEYQKKQADLVAEHIKKQDIVITTALIPGRAAPKLLTAAHIKSMKPGSVIVDLAAVQGGNTELTEKGKVITRNGVIIIGHENFPARLGADSSALYAKNILNFLNLLIDKEKGELAIDWEDEIVKGVALTKDGKIIHPNFESVKVAATTTTKSAPKKTASETATKKKTPAKKSPASKTAKKTDKKEAKA